MVQYNHLVFIALSCLVLSSVLCRAVNGSSDASVQCFDAEREALLQFKSGITNDTCGALTSWVREADCCNWRGVRCSNHTGHVIALDIIGTEYWPCLHGKVSPSLGELKHLRRLNISSNTFDSEIPYQLGNLSKLTTLDLSYSGLNGGESVQWLSRLTRLRYLDLSNTNIGNATDWMQAVSSLSSLSVLRMNDCSLTAKIPASLTYVNSSASLSYISLSDNYFRDNSIFRWLSNFPGITSSLSYLDLSDNFLKPPISNKVWNMPSLTHLFLSGNGFNQSVFQIVGRLCYLQELNLANNYFTDELPNVFKTALGCADKALLTTLDLSNNFFSGSIPDTIKSFSSLRELYLDGNNLNGTITQGIGQLQKLERLYVSSNSLQGSLTTEHFLHLSSLQEFSSWGNSRLVVNISDDWFPPFQLDVLNLESCKLGPYFPKWLQTQKNLSVLDISNAEISDVVPVSFWNSLSPKLINLNLSYNQISGVIPDLSKRFYELTVVDLSSNLFEGFVPSWVFSNFTLYLNDNRFSNTNRILCPKTKSRIEEVDLSNNFFSEELPDCWMNYSMLTSLDLENNNFYGSVPKSFGYLNQLEYLHLYNNSFSGHLPTSLRSCKSLMILNLGYNSFTGHIPPWIGNALPNLGALSLRRNKFLGELPLSLCQLSSLQILDVSGNNISGIIPKCIQNFTTMGKMINTTLEAFLSFPVTTLGIDDMYRFYITEHETTTLNWKREEQMIKDTIGLYKSIDLSGNELTGEIPDGITRLTGLGSLDLSGNKLTGSIPPEIGELSELQLLDFSNNQLTGNIPGSLAKVSYLEIFNVSNNKLSGRIPLSTQLQSFDPSSYTGNPGLCGAPLPECPGDRAPADARHRFDSTTSQDKHDDDGIFPGLYISVVFGLIVGFWGVCGTLAVKRSLRWAYFRLLDDIYDRVYVITVLFVAKFWRKP